MNSTEQMSCARKLMNRVLNSFTYNSPIFLLYHRMMMNNSICHFRIYCKREILKTTDKGPKKHIQSPTNKRINLIRTFTSERKLKGGRSESVAISCFVTPHWHCSNLCGAFIQSLLLNNYFP